MGRIKTVVEATWEDEDGDHRGSYYLLHWGLRYDMVPDSNGNMLPVHYTVGICQNMSNGTIEMFLPGQLKVIGVNLKEEEE